jgi:uncharacterized delta-60 repeat protein
MATTLTPNLKLRIDSNLTANAKYNLSKIDLLGSTFLVDSTNTLKIRSQTSLVLEPNSADIGGDGIGGTVEIGTTNHQLDELNIYVDEVTFNGTLIVEDIVVSGSLELSNGTHTTTLAPAASGQTEDLTLRFPSNNGTATSVLSTDGAGNLSWADPTFAVTSVDLTAPADIFSVSGVPITSAGTIALTKVNQTANQVYAGPTAGAATQPAFRSLVSDDIPTLPQTKVGLGNVDNTSDLNKPISTATQTALNNKYDASNPSGFVNAAGAAAAAPVQSVNGQTAVVSLDSDDITEGATNLYYTTARAALKQNSLGTGTVNQFLRGDLTWQTIATPAKILTVGSNSATIAGCIALATSPSSTNNYVIEIPPGMYTENLTIPCNVHLKGLVNPNSSFSVVIIGQHTITGGGAPNNNKVTIANIAFVNAISLTPTLTISGSAETEVQMFGCTISHFSLTSGINVRLQSNAKLYINSTRMLFSAGASGTHFQIDSGGSLYTQYGLDVINGRAINITGTGIAQLTNANLNCNDTAVITVASGGLVMCESTSIINTASVGNGVSLASSAMLLASQCTFNIVDSMSSEVVTGSAGSSFGNFANNYSNITGVQIRNIKINSNVTQLRYSNSLSTADINDFVTNVRSVAVADTITDGITNIAPSQNAVFDALGGKAALVHTHVASNITDFATAAKAATTDPTLLSDIETTRLGYKKYLSGTAYNGGVVPTITGSVDGTITGAVLIPYQLQDGSWRLRGSIPQANLSVFYANISPGLQSTVSALAIQSDGSILAGGAFFAFKGNLRVKLVRFGSDGTEDTAFYTNLGTGFTVGDVLFIAVQSDGKILVGGTFTILNGITRNRLVRLNSDGTVDTAFYTNLGTAFGGTVSAVAVQSDGKILVGGNFTTLNGITRNYLVRLNSDGTEDTAFYTNLGTGFNNSVETLAVQSDGKILVGGTFQNLNGILRNRFVRLNSDGTVDTAFYTNLGAGFNQNVITCALQSDGKILVGGLFTGLNANTRNALVRLNSNGTEDTAFYTNLGASFATPPGLQTIAVQSDGKILAGGNYTLFNSQFRARLIRLNTDGTEDVAFSTNLGVGFGGGIVSKIAVQSDNKIIVSGGFTAFRDIIKNRLIRLNTDGTEAEITSYTYTISDLTFSSTQSVTGSLGLGTATSGTNVITIGSFSSAIGSTLLSKSGCIFDVALTSKPTWAY